MTAAWMIEAREALGPEVVLGIDYHHRLHGRGGRVVLPEAPGGDAGLPWRSRDPRRDARRLRRAPHADDGVPFAIGEEFASEVAVPALSRGAASPSSLAWISCNVGGFTEGDEGRRVGGGPLHRPHAAQPARADRHDRDAPHVGCRAELLLDRVPGNEQARYGNLYDSPLFCRAGPCSRARATRCPRGRGWGSTSMSRTSSQSPRADGWSYRIFTARTGRSRTGDRCRHQLRRVSDTRHRGRDLAQRPEHVVDLRLVDGRPSAPSNSTRVLRLRPGGAVHGDGEAVHPDPTLLVVHGVPRARVLRARLRGSGPGRSCWPGSSPRAAHSP